MAEWHLLVELALWITHVSQPLHARLADRLVPLMTGMVFVLDLDDHLGEVIPSRDLLHTGRRRHT
jgi:hypothetical protein